MQNIKNIKKTDHNILSCYKTEGIGFLIVFGCSILSFFCIYGSGNYNPRFFASYPATAVVTYGCFVHLKYRRTTSFLCAMIISWLPWHYFYNMDAQRYCYFLLPVIVVGFIDIATKESERWSKWKWGGLLLVLLIVGVFQRNVAVATFVLFVISVLYGRGKRTDGYKIAIAMTMLGLCIMVPFLYKVFKGMIDRYSLADIKCSTLGVFWFFVPIPGHRVPALESLFLTAREELGFGELPIYMGGLLSIGFVFLFAHTVLKKYADRREHFICIANFILLVISHRDCASVLIGTVFPYFSGYDSFYLYIAIFACLGLAILVDSLLARLSRKIEVFVIIILTIVCLLDMSSEKWSQYHSYDYDAKEYCNVENEA